MKTSKDVMDFIEEKGIKIVDVKFTDLFGQWQHFSMPVEEFDEETAFEEGMGFDGSSIRGFQSIEASDMILLADPTTAVIDPICEMPTLSLVCSIFDPITREPYSRDPRYVAKKAVDYLNSTGIADTAYFGPEAEFFVFDQVIYSAGEYSSAYQVDSVRRALGILAYSGLAIPSRINAATSLWRHSTPCRIYARKWFVS